MREHLRNIAIIAHVDHGKTTLVDKLFQQCGTLGRRDAGKERIMDSNDQERERGITILAKNTAIDWNGYRINIVDTPGHADFGGEVERILSMVDSVLLLVDAVDGPMPQTRFVTRKAFEAGLNPIVVVNKVDRPGARPHWVMDQVFDLFDRLGATDEQLDFPVIYASALNGVAGPEPDQLADDMSPLLEMIVARVPPPPADSNGPFQMQICALDYSSYVGVIGIGRVKRGVAKPGMQVVVIEADGTRRNARINSVLGQMGMEKAEIAEGEAGDIVSITGIDNLKISSTLCDPAAPEALPVLTIDQPTVSMTFQVNDSPFAGREGQYVTSRNIRDRLERELLSDVALRVQDGSTPDRFVVSGRGELHLSVLIEKMRREGFEMGVSRPEVIRRVIDGVEQEPFESLLIDCEETHQGPIMEEMGKRRGELRDMVPDGKGRVRLEYMIPSRGIIGFRNQFLTMTSGTGVLNSIFDHYGPVKAGRSRRAPERRAGLDGRRQGARLRAVQPAGARAAVHRAERRGLRGPADRHPQPRQRPRGEPDQGQAADQRACRRLRREHPADAADPHVAGAGAGLHRRGRAGRGHAAEHPPAQEAAEGSGAPPRRAPGRVGRHPE